MMDEIKTRLLTLCSQAYGIWLQGGWAMVPIAVIAFVMFAVGLNVLLQLREKGFLTVPESTWRGWIDRPGRRRGPIGQLLDFVTGPSDIDEMAQRFEQLRTTETLPFERELRVMKTCVSAAPLVGLLGTVTGMLATFGALSSGSGGDKTMAMVAKGISEALITTETGLVIALPGLFFQYQLVRKFERYKAFLAHLETVCTQALYRRHSRAEQAAVRRAASAEVARRLHERLGERAVRRLSPGSDGVRPAGSGDRSRGALAAIVTKVGETAGARPAAKDPLGER